MYNIPKGNCTEIYVSFLGCLVVKQDRKGCDFLMKDFHIYAVDTIGHPGKSAEVCLSPNNYDYGKWVDEIIETLDYDKISCFGSSFGAGTIAKTMCVVPNKMEKVVLCVPSYMITGIEDKLKEIVKDIDKARKTIKDKLAEGELKKASQV